MTSQEDGRDNPERGQLSEYRLIGAVYVALIVQAIAIFVITQYNSENIPISVSMLVPAISAISAFLLGYDASNLRKAQHSFWRPRPWVWGLGMLLPGVNVGILSGYVFRRMESVAEPVPSDSWFRLVVATVVPAAAGATLIATVSPASVSPVLLESIRSVTVGAFGLSLVAAYYDVTYVGAVLETVDKSWIFSGYHWVLILTLFLPPSVLFVGVYYVRRRMLLDSVDGTPQELLAAHWSPARDTPTTDSDGEAETDL